MVYKKLLQKMAAALLTALFLVSASVTPAFAANSDVDQYEQQKSALDADIKAKEKELNSFNEEKKKTDTYLITLTQNMDLMRGKINVLESQIDELQQQIKQKENDIADLGVQIADKKAEFDVKKAEYMERLKVLYISGSVSSLEVLLSSGDFASLLTKTQLVSSVSKQDQAALEGLEAAMAEIEKAQAALEADKTALVASKAAQDASLADLESQRNTLADEAAKSRAVAESLQGSISDAKEEISDNEDTKAALDAKIQRILHPPQPIGGAPSAPIITPGDGITTGQMIHPCPGRQSVSVYWPYYKDGSWHGGMDFGCGSSRPDILAADGGVVVTAGWSNTGYGNHVIIYHSNGLFTLYGHASALYVQEGQIVSKGQKIAQVGSTGNSSGNHLHFEVRYGDGTTNRQSYDPASYLPYI